MFRSFPGSTVFYPTDAVSAERATEMAANLPGERGRGEEGGGSDHSPSQASYSFVLVDLPMQSSTRMMNHSSLERERSEREKRKGRRWNLSLGSS